MKLFRLLLFFIFCSSIAFAQNTFVLKNPDTLKLKQEFLKSDYGMNIVLTYLERNYKETSAKTAIKTDPEFNNQECGFTKKFEFNIEYTLYECGEAAPKTEKITFQKTSLVNLKKWIELMHASEVDEILNVWYINGTEYGPKDKEAGCYYKIEQTKTESIISIWCGC
ncbi:MAG: hypothetical protein JKY02_08780 [Flavobacteriaceae bacterium]|nr:hypothetical protein [Flavobacteriaceae bacterium]